MPSRCPEVIAVASLALVGCTREHRNLSDQWVASGMSASKFEREYQYNAYAMAQGKHLFEWFNCVGCHAHGGGAIGPPLMDSDWIYGSAPAAIYETIMQGRPNGMPSFRERISETQAWELVAYVRSMSGQSSKAASPSRSDSMQVREAEQSTPREKPTGGPSPGSAQPH
jgi:cytochrome c oxidase cbb3-type subunit 3